MDVLSQDPVSSIQLKSDRLFVEIAVPGSVYGGTRFDWSGFITQVTLDGKHTFCVPESLKEGEGTGGIGICNEFGNEKTVGFEDARPGDLFPKLGIGLLRRPDKEGYNFFHPYEIAQPFHIQVEETENQARFVVDPLDCRGYAAQLTKTVSLRSNELLVEYHLKNVGSRLIDTHEYCHNFIGINGQAVSPDYHLRLPYHVALEDMRPSFRVMFRKMGPVLLRKYAPDFLLNRLVDRYIQRMTEVLDFRGGHIHFIYRPESPFFCRLQGFALTQSPQWDLLHIPSEVGMREYDDFPPARVAIWGTTHVISAEVFVDIRLQPGESQSWSRRFEFLAPMD